MYMSSGFFGVVSWEDGLLSYCFQCDTHPRHIFRFTSKSEYRRIMHQARLSQLNLVQ